MIKTYLTKIYDYRITYESAESSKSSEEEKEKSGVEDNNEESEEVYNPLSRNEEETYLPLMKPSFPLIELNSEESSDTESEGLVEYFF